MIKKDHPGKDPYEVWTESEFYRNEAATRAAKKLPKQGCKNHLGNQVDNRKTDEEVIAEKMDESPLPGFAK